jgi:hypothetical protein
LSTDIVLARNAEEDEADEVIAKPQQLDVDSTDFDRQFAEFSKAVSEHAEAEERRVPDHPDPATDPGRRRTDGALARVVDQQQVDRIGLPGRAQMTAGDVQQPERLAGAELADQLPHIKRLASDHGRTVPPQPRRRV